MPSKSAGIIAYRKRRNLEILLVHPGGPFWRNKDLGAWSIPKGEYAEEEDEETAARREFAEELGFEPSVPLIALAWLPAGFKRGSIVNSESPATRCTLGTPAHRATFRDELDSCEFRPHASCRPEKRALRPSARPP